MPDAPTQDLRVLRRWSLRPRAAKPPYSRNPPLQTTWLRGTRANLKTKAASWYSTMHAQKFTVSILLLTVLMLLPARLTSWDKSQLSTNALFRSHSPPFQQTAIIAHTRPSFTPLLPQRRPRPMGKRGRAPPSTGHGLSRRKAQNERRILRIFEQRSCVQVDRIFLDRKVARRGRVFSPCWDEDTSRPLSELLAQAANR